MAKRERWYFTKEELENSPSRRCGIDAEKELYYRQQAANLIQDMGQKLKVTQLVINTAIVYMHRFYTFHSLNKFHRNAISACSLFLAAKVEEQPRKLEHVIRVSQICIFRENVDIKSEQYQRLASELVYNENLMLRTLGFDLNVQHPHTSIVNCCHLVKATKYIAETSYYLATNSLHLSTLCLQYKPTVVACICIYFVCKWSNFQFARSTEGKDWWTYVDQTVNKDMLEELMSECVAIFQKCPQRLKKCLSASKINNKLPIANNPLFKQIEDANKLQLDKPALDEHSKQLQKDASKVLHDSRQTQSSSLLSKNAFSDLSKKDASSKADASHGETPLSRLGPKHVHNHQSNQSTANLFNKDNSSPFSHLPPNTSSKMFASKETNPIDERLKMKESLSNSSFSDNSKPNSSVIPSNPLGNISFSDGFDSHSLFSNDTSDLTDFTNLHKKDFMPDDTLKMEFSDNDDSNPDNNLNFASMMMNNDSNDSKSLSHTFSSKPNVEIAPSYDFKSKPSTFSQFSSQDLSNSLKAESKIEPESKISLNSSFPNSVLPNSLLFQSQLPPAVAQPKPYLDFESKMDPQNEKSTLINHKSANVFANKKEVPKNNISTESHGLVNPSIFNPINEMNQNSAAASVPPSKLIPSQVKHPHDNLLSNSLLNQTSTFGSALDESDNASDNDSSNHDSIPKHKHKKKHKHKEKHKKHKKHKEREKHRDKYESFKVVESPNQPEKLAPIKLKISKAMLEQPPSADADKSAPIQPIKLKISLGQSVRSPSESPPVSRKRAHDDKAKSTNKYDHGNKVARK